MRSHDPRSARVQALPAARAIRMDLVAPLVLLSALVQQEFELLPWPLFAAALGAASALALWRVRPVLKTGPERVTAAVWFLISMAIAAAPAAFDAQPPTLYHLVRRFAAPLAAWASVLLLLESGPAAERARVEPRVKTLLPLLLAGTFLLVAVGHLLMEKQYAAVVDETLYVLQGRMVLEGGLVRRIDPALAPFFVLKQTIIDNGRFYTQYPPGWPVLLALFDAAGIRWWAGVVMSTLGVLFTYLLGREVHSGGAGLVAALLLASNQIFVVLGAGYFAHVPALTLTVAAAWLLVRAERTGGRARVLLWWCAGFLLAAGFCIRPLTGAALGAAVLLWLVLRGRYDLSVLARLAATLAVGAVLPLLGLLKYNATLTGDPLVFGYTSVNGALHDLGFGTRGWMLPDSLGRMVPQTIQFTPLSAAKHLIGHIYELGVTGLPALMIWPVVYLALRQGYRFRWQTVLPFLALPLAYFFYWYSSIRFYTEALPFLYIGIATLILHIGLRQGRLARTLLASMLAAQLVLTAANIHYNWSGRQRIHFPSFARVQEAQKRFGKVLVFVPAARTNQELLEGLAWFNIRDFPGNVIVARDLGPANEVLLERFPQHTPVRVFRSGNRVELTPLLDPRID